jgi:Xaa-Pro aminopeptidase
LRAGHAGAAVEGFASRRAETVRLPTAEAELERRWRELRRGMEHEGLDVLLVHNHVDGLGGYVKYFCDMSTSGGYPLSVIFPREGPMTLVTHGPQGDDQTVSPSEDALLYGVERILSTSSFSSASYTSTYDGEQIVRALKGFAAGRIGLVGLAQMPYAMLGLVKERFPSASFVDAADVVDPVKAVKSDYERDAIGRSVELQVAAFHAALAAIEPGRQEWEVTAAALAVARAGGSEHGPVMVGSAPPGRPAIFKPARHQSRVLESGDRLTILIEPSGPEGMYAEIGRTIVIGSADDELLEEHARVVEAWQHYAAMLRPGASARQIDADYNAFLREHERPEDRRLGCHGQGYDIVERPLVRGDEPMSLAEGMLIAVHPMYVHAGAAYWVCDNVFVEPDGPSPPLHGIAQKVFEV